MTMTRPYRRRRWLTSVVTTGAMVIMGLTASATAAQASFTGYRVTGTGGIGLKVRVDANDPNARVVMTLTDGTYFTAECAVRGRDINGNTVWHLISAPASGWISDFYTNTPGFNQFIPGERDCRDAPPPAASREDRALAWARSVIGQSSTNGDLGDSNHAWKDWCDNFVAHAYGRPSSGYVSAIAHFNDLDRHGLIHRDANPPAGALVFYGAAPVNQQYGHVMLSEGNGSYISTGPTVQRVSFTAPAAPYIGWSWANPDWTGR